MLVGRTIQTNPVSLSNQSLKSSTVLHFYYFFWFFRNIIVTVMLYISLLKTDH